MAESNLSQEQRDEACCKSWATNRSCGDAGLPLQLRGGLLLHSVSTGTFSLFIWAWLLLSRLFWSWPIVALGQTLVALNFAELSSHFPIAGSIYQWSKRLSGHSLGWFTGWIYFLLASSR